MSRFTEAELYNFVNTTDQRMSQASQQLAGFSQSVQDVYANWVGYVTRETNETQLAESRVAFATKARALVDSRKAAFAAALDIIAGGMMDAQGNPLTRQNLLDEIAAV
jgi:hypothetical protein